MRRACIIVCLLLSSVAPAANALDPGTVTGTLEIAGEHIPLAHSIAMMLDDAEGLRDGKRELRILLSDREALPATLLGAAFPPIRQMAVKGEIKGLLIELDPSDLTAAQLIPLVPPEPGHSLATLSVSNSGGVFQRLSITPQRVVGKGQRGGPAGPDSEFRYDLEFSAPVFNPPPITADLTGKAAQASPQVKAMRAAADALARGDTEALKQLTSSAAYDEMQQMLEQLGPGAKKMMARYGGQMRKRVDAVSRVVVRGDRAVAIVGKPGKGGKEWSTLVREGDTWNMTN